MVSSSPHSRPHTLQRWLIRFCAFVLSTGLPAVLVPGVALEKFSWLMGYGKPTLEPLTVYLSGNTGFVYVAMGILFWMVSNDVARYQNFVKAIGWILLIGGPVYLSIDLQSGLPLWWVLLDTVSCLVIGTAILLASKRVTKESN